MSLAHAMVTLTIKGLTGLLCRVDDAQLARVPACGPLLMVTNHINFLDVPVMYPRLLPRPVTGLVKAETWDNPAMAVLFDLWGGIPVRRGEADLRAMRQALAALRAGKIVAIAPEGTRSGDGCLRRAHPGIVLLALHSRAPLLPVVYYGGENFRVNLSRLRRTDFHIRVGQPFRLQAHKASLTRQARQQIADAIMARLAALLPPDYRGVYADLPQSSPAEAYFSW